MDTWMPFTAFAYAQAAADYVRARSNVRPTVGLILGSGLGSLADAIEGAEAIPYAEIPHFPQTTVTGHGGRLIVGTLAGKQVCVLQGRVHYYEGYSPVEVVQPVRLLQMLGVQVLIITNAAGGIRAGLQVGDLLAITDHINLVGLSGNNPLRGPNDDSLGERFPDMTHAYDPALLALARDTAKQQSIALQEGVYVMVSGPNYETPAEIRLLRLIGADVVGMSTAPEVIAARHGGMRVLAISMISNITIDSTESTLQTTHEHVLLAGRDAAPRLARLIKGVVGSL
jgi:purine-nucleoside phosphorylase